MDLLQCPKPNPEEAAQINSEEDYQKDILANALDSLKPREKEVLIRRKLLATPETLEVIANDLEVTRACSPIEVKAMTKLKRVLISQGLLNQYVEIKEERFLRLSSVIMKKQINIALQVVFA